MRITTGVAALIASGLAAGSANADNTLIFIHDNDVLTDTDRYYSAGSSVTFVGDTFAKPLWVQRTASFLPGLNGELKAGIGAAHLIFTPDDGDAEDAPPDDHPYAGLLFGSAILASEGANHADFWRLDLGVIGPAALGEEVQDVVHSILDIDDLRGWDGQIGNEPAVLLTYQYRWRKIWDIGPSGMGVEVSPAAGVSLGNVAVLGTVGGRLRFGWGLDRDFGPSRAWQALNGSFTYKRSPEWTFYLFGGAETRFIGRSIVLDGSTNGDGPSVDRDPVVTDFIGGGAIAKGRFQGTITYVDRTQEFDTQIGDHAFLSLSAGWVF